MEARSFNYRTEEPMSEDELERWARFAAAALVVIAIAVMAAYVAMDPGAFQGP